MDFASGNSKTPQIPAAPTSITLAQAFLYWLKLGFISFGGPAGQIAIMHHDLVEEKRWISERRFLHALNYCMILPGPEAQQLATYIGWLLHRTWGGIIAGVLFILPSFFVLVVLAWIYMAYGSLPAVSGMLYGFKPAVVAIVLFAAYRIGSRVLKNIGNLEHRRPGVCFHFCLEGAISRHRACSRAHRLFWWQTIS